MLEASSQWEGARLLFIFLSAITLQSLMYAMYGIASSSAQLIFSFKEEPDLNCLVNTLATCFLVVRFKRGPQSFSRKGNELSREMDGHCDSTEVQKALCSLFVRRSEADSALLLEVQWANGYNSQCQLICAQAVKTSLKHLTLCN